MKLEKPSKVILIGHSEGVEGLFLHFNRNDSDSYPEHPLDGSISQVMGLVEGIPVLAFYDDDAAMESLETMIRTTPMGEKISIGIVTSLEYLKRAEMYFKWLKTLDLNIISRFVFFIDCKSTQEMHLPEGYGVDDFLPLEIVMKTCKKDLDKLIQLYNGLPDAIKAYCLRAFDLVFFPISTLAGIGLEPSSQALIMEADT